MKCRRCEKETGEGVIDSQGDSYCQNCVKELVDRGIYSSIDDFQGFDNDTPNGRGK